MAALEILVENTGGSTPAVACASATLDLNLRVSDPEVAGMREDLAQQIDVLDCQLNGLKTGGARAA
jgi:hypothetical protein